jgi:CRISPR/Cas system-associated exonuclease Cas4 (RecB family)
MKGFEETRYRAKTNKTENKKINKTNNKTNKNASVFVFEVRQWMICPRQLFFKNHQQSKQEENDNDHFSFLYKTDPVRYFEKEMIHDVCFELPALVLESVDKNDKDFINKTKLKNKIENAIEESKKCRLLLEQNSIEKIQDIKITKEIEEAALKTKLYADEIIDHISKTIETHGFGILESAAEPFLEEKLFHFSKIDLYGSPKKVIIADEKLAPYFIRFTKPPENGVWESDRITAAAYTMILENEFGKQAISENAVIDYLGDFRVLRIRYADKKKVFRTVRKIKDIKNGQMPSEKNIRLCEKCMFKETCRPKAKTFFSRIFGDHNEK